MTQCQLPNKNYLGVFQECARFQCAGSIKASHESLFKCRLFFSETLMDGLKRAAGVNKNVMHHYENIVRN